MDEGNAPGSLAGQPDLPGPEDKASIEIISSGSAMNQTIPESSLNVKNNVSSSQENSFNSVMDLDFDAHLEDAIKSPRALSPPGNKSPAKQNRTIPNSLARDLSLPPDIDVMFSGPKIPEISTPSVKNANTAKAA